MKDEKYVLSEASPEDMGEFKKGMDDLLNRLSLVCTLNINKKGVSIKLENGEKINSFVDEPTLLIQKKTKQVEDENSIESPYNEEDSTPTA